VSTEQGKRLLLRICGPGELLSASLSGPHGSSVTAVSRCVTGFVAREHVLDLGRRYPELLLTAHLRLEERQRLLARRLADLAYTSTRRRLVRVLLELGEEHGAPEGGGVRVDIPLSLRDLAEMIGAARPTTSAELQSLARRGLIKLAWPTVFLLDRDGLRRFG
jgi:CRP/FNR family transcriptional regulator